MDETTQPSGDAETQQANRPDTPTSASDEADPRQTAIVEAYLAQQRAAMGFT